MPAQVRAPESTRQSVKRIPDGFGRCSHAGLELVIRLYSREAMRLTTQTKSALDHIMLR